MNYIMSDNYLKLLELENQQNKLKLDSYKNKVRNLRSEIIELKKELPLSLLFKRFDKAIRLNIQKLNLHKQKPHSNCIPIIETTNIKKRLEQIKIYDFSCYYSTKHKRDRLLYRIILGTYLLLSRFIVKFGYFIYKIIGKAKK